MIVFCALSLSVGAGEKPVLQPKVCPTPVRAEIAAAEYVPLKAVAFSCADAAAADWAWRHLADWYGPHAPELTAGGEACPAEAEAYRLTVNASGVRISAGSLAGARWALQTLRQLAIPARGTEKVAGWIVPVKPGLLFEFRQAYVGPVIRKYGNMVRVGDCPGSQLRNRVHIANMRLLCDGTSVHADMLRWHPDETPENAQRFILSSLFGTVQYSVMLREAKPETKAMIAKWIRFSDEHRETLLKGDFRPHFPHLNYPVIEAESAAERIVVIYDPAVKFDLGPVRKKTYVIDGLSGAITVKE